MAPKRSDGLTRRDFLRGTGLGTLGWGVALAAGCGRNSAEAPAQQAEPATEVPPQAQTTKVVIARDPEVISDDGQYINDDRLRELMAKALGELTGGDSLTAALGQFVKPTDKVGIKQNVMLTPVHQEVLWALWEALAGIGVPPENVITWDRRRGHKGYESGAPVGITHDADSVATVCSEFADILINVPGLKAHSLSGIGVCLKNWAGAVGGLNVRDQNTPWPIHGDSCVDIGMMQAHPSIKDKARLCIVDGLRALCHGGPQVNPQYLWNYAGIIVGSDAVAVDRVCLDIIQQRRNEVRREEWPVSPPPKHVMVAAEKYGLGEANLDNIDVVEV
jgi:hypothetical protein